VQRPVLGGRRAHDDPTARVSNAAANAQRNRKPMIAATAEWPSRSSSASGPSLITTNVVTRIAPTPAAALMEVQSSAGSGRAVLDAVDAVERLTRRADDT